jgi:flagellar hook-basal body complex protein FliE
MDFSRPIEMVRPLASPSLDGIATSGNAQDGEVFRGAFEGALQSVRSSQAAAHRQVQAFLSGEQQDIHQVATAVQKAELTFEVALELRNKVVAAYQEIMRMQI